MTMIDIEFDFIKINISELSNDNHWSLHPFMDYIPETLKKSFQQTGILHPPIAKRQNVKYELICGHRRIDFFLQNNISQISLQILPENISITDQLHIILADQLLSGPLTIVEKAFFIKLASNYLTKDEIVSQFSDQLPCKKHKSTIRDHLQLLEADNAILEMIHNNVLSEQSGISLLSMSHRDQVVISNLIGTLKPGSGKQKRIITMLQDVSMRQGESISKYIQQKEIQDIIQHESMNIPQKVQQLIEYLQIKQTPNIHKAQIDFKQASQKLDLPTYAELNPSQSFEKNDVFLTLKFRNLNDVNDKWQKIKKILERT